MMRKTTFPVIVPAGATSFVIPLTEDCRIAGGRIALTVARGAVDISFKRGATVVAKASLGATDTSGRIIPVTTNGEDKLVFSNDYPLTVDIPAGTASNIGFCIITDPFLIGSK